MKVSVKAGCKTIHPHEFVLEISDDDLEGLTEDERADAINEIVYEYVVQEVLDFGWELAD